MKSGGDVFFDVARDREYGKLTNRTVDAIAGRRGRGGRQETLGGRLCALESSQTGRTFLGKPVGARTPRMAH